MPMTDVWGVMKKANPLSPALEGGGAMEKTNVVLKEESVLLLLICTGIGYSARPSMKCELFVRASTDLESIIEAFASNIK
jgi:hypothetical protein